MSRFLITALVLLFAFPQERIETTFDEQKNVTTVRLPSTQISGPKDRYHSLAFSIYYSYPGKIATAPKDVNLELVSVVKARRLNTDLYVVFVVDGKEMHFGSNRSAIRNPVPGRLWIGERMVFQIPREDFMKLTAARKLGVKLGNVSFDFSESHMNALRSITDRVSGPSAPQQTSPHRL